ncbi:MAG: glycosyltransferase [Candidatus Omnitrophica bacterium]|jgi:glycosyltransferase involved in cell wall biosynthesis|nr:glycosyltransferase [Candidatus Omnitrophota bacterium]
MKKSTSQEIKDFISKPLFDEKIILNQDPSWPKISIITLSYNQAEFLERTILSVLNQNYPSLEYIIIDGGSKDRSVEIIKKYNKYITRWISEPDGGIADAFNKGVKLVSGDWINFMNAGDYFFSDNTLKTISAIIGKLNEEYKIISGFAVSQQFRMPKQILNNNMPIFEKAMLAHQATFFNRTLFRKYGLFDKKYKLRMDFEFLVRILRTEKFKFTEQNICVYDLHGISTKYPFGMMLEQLKIELAYSKKLTYILKLIFVFNFYCAILCLREIKRKLFKTP